MNAVQLAGADPVQVLREIAARGLSITVSGADLRLQGPRERMDPELIGRIKACKAELVAHLAAAAGPAAAAEAADAAEAGGFPLTPLQRSYLLGRGEVFEMGNVANHVYWEVEGLWDLDRLEAALRSVVRRHGMLRTRFTADGRQVEQAWPAPVGIGRLDLRGEAEEEQRRRRLELREQRSHRVLPADRAPLIAVDVTILADDRMVLHVSLDGLVADGISTFLFFRHLWASYQASHQAGPAGQEADEPPEASFEAYVAALEAARTRAPAQRSREYWFSRLDDLAPHPDLPLRTSPSAVTRPRFTQRLVRLDAPSWTALKDRATQAGLTPSGLLLAAYAQVLAAWGAGARFTLTTTVANRPPIHPRIFDAIGNFSDTMLVEVATGRGASFRERAQALQERLRRDLDNRHFSGVELMRELGRRRGGAARMPYTFNSSVGYVYGDVDGSTLELFGPEVYAVSQTPQVWLNVFAMEQHGGLVVKVDSVDELFPEGLPGALVQGYQSLLERLLDEDAWSQAAFDLLPPAQRARRRAANDTAAPLPDGLLQDAFVAQATRAPDAPAVLTTRATLSYGELLARARHAAAWLRARQVGRDELVALVMTRGPEQVVGVLATLLAGAAYLPIDADLPAWRQRYLLRDGKVRCALTNCGWAGDGDRGDGGDGGDGGDRGDRGDGIDVLALDVAEPLDGAAVPDVPPAAGASPDDLAYVLYTSGTTGEPKGVMVSHRSVANVVADCNARFAVEPGDRLFGISAFTFDLSVYDIFGALTAGAAVVLPDHDKAADAAHWLALCERFGVTVWSSVPAIVSLLHDQAVADGPAALATLRLVMMSGDRIPPALPAALRRLRAGLAVVSLGGPTETTIWNILHPVTAAGDGSRSIPYGRPNANNRAYVLDPDGLDAPDWVAGE
ncbi:MAG TPA: AMP-binding protein, partial [Micromonosporaceae bacterium]|nr:AMP-binding protein [Micromonosporaceae bacterium]